MTAAAVQAREHSPIDITSHAFWSQSFTVRDETFAQLRRGEGLTWHRPFASMFPMEEPGYWALTSSTTSSARATSTLSRHALRGCR